MTSLKVYEQVGALYQALQGRKGQAFLKDMLRVLEEMPIKELVSDSFSTDNGGVCALGAVARDYGLDLMASVRVKAASRKLDLQDMISNGEGIHGAASMLGIALPLVAAIVYQNNKGNYGPETNAMRWERVYRWVSKQLVSPAQPETDTRHEAAVLKAFDLATKRP